MSYLNVDEDISRHHISMALPKSCSMNEAITVTPKPLSLLFSFLNVQLTPYHSLILTRVEVSSRFQQANTMSVLLQSLLMLWSTDMSPLHFLAVAFAEVV